MYEEFLTALRELGGKATNKELRATLNWELGPYNETKAILKIKGLIKSSRGRGGGVYLVNVENS